MSNNPVKFQIDGYRPPEHTTETPPAVFADEQLKSFSSHIRVGSNRETIDRILLKLGFARDAQGTYRSKRDRTRLLSYKGFLEDHQANAFLRAFEASAYLKDYCEAHYFGMEDEIREGLVLAAYNAGYAYASLLAYEEKAKRFGARKKSDEKRFAAIASLQKEWHTKNPKEKREPLPKELYDDFMDPCPSKKKMSFKTFEHLMGRSRHPGALTTH